MKILVVVGLMREVLCAAKNGISIRKCFNTLASLLKTGTRVGFIVKVGLKKEKYDYRRD